MKFRPLAINCLEMTSDSEYYKSKSIQEADIILTTPEVGKSWTCLKMFLLALFISFLIWILVSQKFDAVTRHGIRNGDLSFFGDISLVLIDEVHLLNDPRGASLEAIVSRIKMLSHTLQMSSSSLANVRFLAVSATIPNIQDIGGLTWTYCHQISYIYKEMDATATYNWCLPGCVIFSWMAPGSIRRN